MIDISLIVACYNIENYIGDCLNSIFREIRAEHAGRIEILVVNDGSTDTTPAAIDAALKQYDRHHNARLISHKNMGLAASWNDAIAQANGQFVGFLDGDDLMLEGYFTTLLAQIDHTPQTDVIEFDACGFQTPDDLVHTQNHSILQAYFHKLADTAAKKKQAVYAQATWYVWTRLVRTSIARQVHFSGHRLVDICWTPICYWKSHEISSLNKVLVGYRHRPGSLSRKVFDPEILDRLEAFLDWSQTTWQQENDPELKTALILLYYSQFKLYKGLLTTLNFPDNWESKVRHYNRFVRKHWQTIIREYPRTKTLLKIFCPAIQLKIKSVLKARRKRRRQRRQGH